MGEDVGGEENKFVGPILCYRCGREVSVCDRGRSECAKEVIGAYYPDPILDLA